MAYGNAFPKNHELYCSFVANVKYLPRITEYKISHNRIWGIFY